MLAPPVARLLPADVHRHTFSRLMDVLRAPRALCVSAEAAEGAGGAGTDGAGDSVTVPEPLLFQAAPHRADADHILSAAVTFGQRVAAYGESVTLRVSITSRLPEALTLARVQLQFDVPMYVGVMVCTH
jgi:hypothetical protein